MTSLNGDIFRVAVILCGELKDPRWIPLTKPMTRRFDVFFDLCLNKRVNKQSRRWWFETQSRPLWRHCNANPILIWWGIHMLLILMCRSINYIVHALVHSESSLANTLLPLDYFILKIQYVIATKAICCPCWVLLSVLFFLLSEVFSWVSLYFIASFFCLVRVFYGP